MKHITRFFIFLLVTVLVCPAHSEGTDIIHEIWYAMGEAGNIDMSKAWELPGMYVFGETTAAGELNIFATDDPQKVKNTVCWRIIPEDISQLSSQYFPMLKCLMLKLDPSLSAADLDEWISSLSPTVAIVIQNRMAYEFGTYDFGHFTFYLKYSDKYNELYGKLVCTEETEHFTLSK